MSEPPHAGAPGQELDFEEAFGDLRDEAPEQDLIMAPTAALPGGARPGAAAKRQRAAAKRPSGVEQGPAQHRAHNARAALHYDLTELPGALWEISGSLHEGQQTQLLRGWANTEQVMLLMVRRDAARQAVLTSHMAHHTAPDQTLSYHLAAGASALEPCAVRLPGRPVSAEHHRTLIIQAIQTMTEQLAPAPRSGEDWLGL